MGVGSGGTTYTDRMTTAETIQYYLRKMADEAASDGFDKEFEDLVDLLMYTISPLIAGADLVDDWDDIELIGGDLKITDSIKMGVAKRKRIRKKMILAMKIIDKNKMLFRHVNTFKWEFDPLEIKTKVSDKSKGKKGE